MAGASAPAPQLLSQHNAAALVAEIDTFIFDCDGVLFLGTTPIAGAADTIRTLRALGKQLVFVTNNSTLSRAQYKEKFAKLGFEIDISEIFTSSLATAEYLSSIDFTQTVYIVGEDGVASELDLIGIRWEGAYRDRERPSLNECDTELQEYKNNNGHIGAVVVGFDGYISYRKIAKAYLSLLRPSTLFIATNTDKTFPTHGIVLPGGGTAVAALERCSSRIATVMGKPNVLMLDMVARRYHINRQRTLMVGDRLDTDIKFGRDGGVLTLLVETGVNKLADCSASSAAAVPHYCAPSVAALCGHTAQ